MLPIMDRRDNTQTRGCLFEDLPKPRVPMIQQAVLPFPPKPDDGMVRLRSNTTVVQDRNLWKRLDPGVRDAVSGSPLFLEPESLLAFLIL